NAAPAIPHVESILADGKLVGLGDAAHIPGGRRRITFGLAGLSLAAPELVRFRYFLEGYDHGWSDPAATREAVYTNLPPRPYRLRVIAGNPEGDWNSRESTLAFEIDPLFWQTWWFRVGCVVVAAAGISAVYRFRISRLTRQLNLRSEERLAERT